MKFSKKIFNIINFLLLLSSLGFCIYSYIWLLLTCFISSTTGEAGRQAMNFYEFVFWTEFISVIVSLIARTAWLMCIGAGLVNIFIWTAEAIIWTNKFLAPDRMTRLIIPVLITAVLLGNIICLVAGRKYSENNTQNLK